MPLTSSVMGQMMARFRNFTKRLNAFRKGVKIYLNENFLGDYVPFK